MLLLLEQCRVQMQMDHLNRSTDKPLPVIAQKWLTSHPKGAAAGWMLNGVIQSIIDVSKVEHRCWRLADEEIAIADACSQLPNAEQMSKVKEK